MGWFRGARRREAEMDEELGEHLARLVEQNRAAGMSEDEAHRQARLRFGRPSAIKETAREQWTWPPLAALARDLRQGVRALRRTPGFVAAVVLTLALGIGATSAMFSVVDGVLLRPLPYPESHRLMRLVERTDVVQGAVAYLNFADWDAQQTSFQAMGVWRRSSLNYTGAGAPDRLQATQLSGGAFAALAVAPALGRPLTTADDRPGAPDVVVASHAFWASRLGADPAAVGRTLALDGRPRVLVGVMPAGFEFGGQTALWLPIAADIPNWQDRRRRQGLRAIGRLKPGVSLHAARAELDTIAARLERQHPDANGKRRVQIDGLLDSQVQDARRALWILLGAAGFVLAIACANVAGLLLARTVARRRELAVRAALGAGRGGLIRQVLAEALLLAGAGAAAGWLLAAGLVRGIRVWAERLPRAAEITVDGRVLAFTAAATLLAALAFALLPALRAADVDLAGSLRRDGRGSVGGRTRLRQALVVTQVALTVVLLVGAGLLLRSFHHLQAVDPGFAPQQVLSFRVNLSVQKYPDRARQRAFYRDLEQRLRHLPGVDQAALGSQIPFDDRQSSSCFAIRGRPVPPLPGCPSMELHFVSPGYLATLGIPLRAGRSFTADDERDVVAPTGPGESWGNLRTIVVDEEFVRRHFPGQDPIGQQIWWPWVNDRPMQTIVGVVGRVKLTTLRDQGGDPQAYFPFGQAPVFPGLTAVLKSRLPAEQVIAMARAEVQAIDPEQPLFDVRTLTELRDRTLSADRLNLGLLGGFAGLALILALVGLYGLIAYQVVQGQAEIGVRLALGAQRGRVLAQVIGRALALAGLGAALGLAGAMGLGTVLSALLFQVRPFDPVTLGGVIAVVLTVAVLASWLPGRRAALLDPMVVLRHE